MVHLLSCSEISLFLHHDILAGERCIMGRPKEALLLPAPYATPPPPSPPRLPRFLAILPPSAENTRPFRRGFISIEGFDENFLLLPSVSR